MGYCRYLALRQQPDAARTCFQVVRMHNLMDECVLSMSMQLIRPCARLCWQVSWSPDSSLVAIWCEVGAPDEQPGLPGRPCSSHMLICEAGGGQTVLDISMQGPVQGLSPSGEPGATRAWSPDAQQFAFWGQPSDLDISRDCLVLVDVISGHLQAWTDPQLEAGCMGLQWAGSTRWLMITLREDEMLLYKEQYKVALDASDCSKLWILRLTQTSISPPWWQAILCWILSSLVSSGCMSAHVVMLKTQPAWQAGPTWAIHITMIIPPEFAEGVCALSPDGSLLVCVMCMLVGDDGSSPVLLQRASPWTEKAGGAPLWALQGRRVRLLRHGSPPVPWRDAWGVLEPSAADIAWKPCCPLGRQVSAVVTAKWDLVLVAAFDQHLLLKIWSLQELVSMGLNDCFKADDEPAVSFSWSADGSHLLCSTDVEPCLDEGISSCVVMAFSWYRLRML